MAGISYEKIGERRDRQRFPQIGKSVDIGGRTLNIYCSGEGGPSVILESGGAGPGYVWDPIQREVAKFTRSCWYDRAGEGWSDPGPFPHTSEAIAKDLHGLLRGAGVAPPFVLVGASFGGLNVRVYNGLYPNEVAGMVLVDSAHAGKPPSFDDPEMNRQAAEYQQVWIHQMQAQLARLSTRGRQVIVKDSDHSIAPEAVLAATREVVAAVRN